MKTEKVTHIDPKDIPNVVLKRLISEIQWELKNNINGYNRIHNRHNRSKTGLPPLPPP